MRSAATPQPLLLLLILTFCSFSSFNVGFVAASESSVGENTFTPKGYLMRYWKKQISNDLLKPEFLLEKASLLSASQYALKHSVLFSSTIHTNPHQSQIFILLIEGRK
ncbi:hypothetical protein ACS0TY_033051 [Phlomoides rotata]